MDKKEEIREKRRQKKKGEEGHKKGGQERRKKKKELLFLEDKSHLVPTQLPMSKPQTKQFDDHALIQCHHLFHSQEG